MGALAVRVGRMDGGLVLRRSGLCTSLWVEQTGFADGQGGMWEKQGFRDKVAVCGLTSVWP